MYVYINNYIYNTNTSVAKCDKLYLREQTMCDTTLLWQNVAKGDKLLCILLDVCVSSLCNNAYAYNADNR